MPHSRVEKQAKGAKRGKRFLKVVSKGWADIIRRGNNLAAPLLAGIKARDKIRLPKFFSVDVHDGELSVPARAGVQIPDLAKFQGQKRMKVSGGSMAYKNFVIGSNVIFGIIQMPA